LIDNGNAEEDDFHQLKKKFDANNFKELLKKYFTECFLSLGVNPQSVAVLYATDSPKINSEGMILYHGLLFIHFIMSITQSFSVLYATDYPKLISGGMILYHGLLFIHFIARKQVTIKFFKNKLFYV
jgi:hypothetical protein